MAWRGMWQAFVMSHVLTINGGSSSIRFALYDAADCVTKLVDGKIDRIGAGAAEMTVGTRDSGAMLHTRESIVAADYAAAVDHLMKWFASRPVLATLGAVGHRVVHGMNHAEPERVTPGLMEELKRIVPYDSEHLPGEIHLIEAVGRQYPHSPQVACFDTAFHRSMPRIATILPIPRRYQAKGVQRYGFHGLSYTYLMHELARIAGATVARGRVILAHLGNGASLAAVRDGKCIDTSMAFTPTAGLMMSTRSGDLDPGIVAFLAATESMDVTGFHKMVNYESGLLGVSETSSDIRDLLLHERDDVRAAEAVDMFCYQVKKWIGSFAASLGGVDTLVFAGGIGENAASIRGRICSGLSFLGIDVDAARNVRCDPLISPDSSPVAVHVIRTDEESVIARSTVEVMKLDFAGFV